MISAVPADGLVLLGIASKGRMMIKFWACVYIVRKYGLH